MSPKSPGRRQREDTTSPAGDIDMSLKSKDITRNANPQEQLADEGPLAEGEEEHMPPAALESAPTGCVLQNARHLNRPLAIRSSASRRAAHIRSRI